MRNSVAARMLHSMEFGALITLSAIFRGLPRPVVYAFARLLGRFAFRVIGIRRKVTMENLREAFGESHSETELEKIAREAYVSIATTFTEMLLFPKFIGRIPEIVETPDMDVIRQAYDRGKGVILVSGHFGNWEMNGPSIGAAGFPLTVVAKRQSNPFVDAWVHRYRERLHMKIIQPGAPVRLMLRALRNGETIGLISDQDAGSRGVFVNFFGRPASTPRGAAELALKYGLPIVSSMTYRTTPGRYRSTMREIEVREDDTVESLTQRYTSAIEEVIREHPEQYFWMHRRWKTRPPTSSEISEVSDQSVEPGDA